MEFKFFSDTVATASITLPPYTLVLTKSTQGLFTLYDTFEGNLSQANGLLLKSNRCIWYWEGSKLLFQVEQANAVGLAASIQDQDLKDWIEPRITINRLLPLVSGTMETSEFVIRDYLDKVVLEGRYFRLFTEEKSLSFLCFNELKGYSEDAGKVAGHLLAGEWKKLDLSFQEAVFFCFEVKFGRQKLPEIPNLEFDKGLPWLVALWGMYHLEMMEGYRVGVIQDWDTEFLHHFRVSSRKSRSILRLLRGHLSASLTQSGKAFLTLLGKKTNRLRDLDVYLLKKEDYLDDLPDKSRRFMGHFFTCLEQEREEILNDVHEFLSSKQYATLKENYETELRVAKNSSRPDGKKAKQILFLSNRKRFHTILRAGNAIRETSPDHEFHDLRIQCKKMRYLLDFLSHLVPGFPRKVTRELKKIQNILGDFNDLSVQEDFFKEYAQQLPLNLEDRDQILMTVGMLLGEFHRMKQTLRIDFLHEFKEFISYGEDLLSLMEAGQVLQ